jgi:hypothetical protein
MRRKPTHSPEHQYAQEAHEGASRKKIPVPDPRLYHVYAVLHRLGRYWRDIVAILLLVLLAPLMLFGLSGLSDGSFVNALAGILWTWFGWGAWLVPLTLAWVGWAILAQNFGTPKPVRWGRIVAGEVALFTLLALFNLLNGRNVALATAGEGGGLVGWGLGYLFAAVFPSPADAFVLIMIFLGSLVLALDVTADRLAALWERIKAQGFADAGATHQLPLPFDEKRNKAGGRGRTLAERLRAEAHSKSNAQLAAKTKPKLAAGERLKIPVESVADEIKVKPKKRDRRLPGYELLDNSDLRRPAEREINDTASVIVKALNEFGVPVKVLGAKVGPSVTQYQVEPGFVEKSGPPIGNVAKLLDALRILGEYCAKNPDLSERELIDYALNKVNLFPALGYEDKAEEYVEQSRNSVLLRNAKGRTLVIIEFRRPAKELEVNSRAWDENPLPEVGAVCNGHGLWICPFSGNRMSDEPLAKIALAKASDTDARTVQNWLGKKQQWKVRVAQIASLQNDLALALSATTIRIEAPVPGHGYVGIEVPHRRTSIVGLRPVMEAESFHKLNKPLTIALGRDVSGGAIAADLGSMPHLLIAGTTGSGKTVCVISIVTCLVVNNTPDDLRMVMIDPKMVELVRFNGLPHLYGKVETELTRILGVLRWTVREMERRYKLFEQAGARNLDTYHAKMARRGGKGDSESHPHLPRIVVIIDELADLMMQAPDETERMVVRLAQMARATGIHLVVATQRPSVDVVTGLIKANFPARIAFAVASSIDSRVIIDQNGAESLLGKGDMLFLSPEAGAPIRLQGCFATDKEIDKVVNWWKEQADEYADEPQADVAAEAKVEAELLKAEAEAARPTGGAPLAPWDEMLAREAVIEDKDRQIEQAIEIVKKYGTASASLLQRKMRIGYPRAARLMDELKAMGIVGREQAGGKTREVFVGKDEDPIGQRAARILGAEADDD